MSKARQSNGAIAIEEKSSKKKSEKRKGDGKILSFLAICVFATGLIFISLEKSRSVSLEIKEKNLVSYKKILSEAQNNQVAQKMNPDAENSEVNAAAIFVDNYLGYN